MRVSVAFKRLTAGWARKMVERLFLDGFRMLRPPSHTAVIRAEPLFLRAWRVMKRLTAIAAIAASLIQFFGYTLVQTLASQYTHYYDAVRGNPPFELHDDQLASIINSRDLNHSIKERLRWTLEMDERYYMLARCITVLYHLSSNDYSMISFGFDVNSIREIVRDMFDIHCLAALSEEETAALLDEMEEMGILSRPNSVGNSYLLRRRSFIDVIGSSLEVIEHDIKLYNKEAVNNV